MERVSSTNFQRQIKKWMRAAEKEPVIITKRGKDMWILIGVKFYKKLRRQ